MRIIAGSARGARLDVAAESATRPFLALARGALFNSLLGRLEGARVLDLYAGSGALGLEALSRGARSAVFVERDRKAVAALRNNIARCGFATAARIVAGDVLSVLERLDAVFDAVFIDPPFPDPAEWDENGDGAILGRLLAPRLAEGGIAVLRIEGGRVSPPAWNGMAVVRDGVYGRSRVCLYERKPGGGE
jgi:16S rRNA (guanine966-N2)-methyltransferase